MSWKCENCGTKLSGKEVYCPQCATKAIYTCKQCGKVMDNGKHSLCPVCNTEKAEKRNGKLKKVAVTTVSAVGAVGAVLISVVTKRK